MSTRKQKIFRSRSVDPYSQHFEDRELRCVTTPRNFPKLTVSQSLGTADAGVVPVFSLSYSLVGTVGE